MPRTSLPLALAPIGEEPNCAAAKGVRDNHTLSPNPPPLGCIRIVPDQGMVLWCDFRDYRSTEIGGKFRPIIVVSPTRLNSHTVYVAPVSHAAHLAKPYDIQIPANRYPFFEPGRDRWVKTQHITPIDRSRLDRWRVRDRYCTPHINHHDLKRILATITAIFAAA